MVSFTGSVRAGKRVAGLAAETIKRVTLELGGKSACVILDDAPFEKAIPSGAKNAMLNSGQTCSAWTRMLVPRGRQQDAIDLAAKAVGGLTIGRSARSGDAAGAADFVDAAGTGGGIYREREETKGRGW